MKTLIETLIVAVVALSLTLTGCTTERVVDLSAMPTTPWVGIPTVTADTPFLYKAPPFIGTGAYLDLGGRVGQGLG